MQGGSRRRVCRCGDSADLSVTSPGIDTSCLNFNLSSFACSLPRLRPQPDHLKALRKEKKKKKTRFVSGGISAKKVLSFPGL